MGVASQTLLDFLQVDEGMVRGVWNGEIDRPAALDGRHETPVLAYCGKQGAEAAKAISESDAKLIFVRRSVIERLEDATADRILIGSDSPRLMFIRAVDRFWPDASDEQASGPAVVHESARVADDARISAGVMIGPGCQVGPGCALYSGVKLYRGTKIGRDVRIDSNSVVGAPGFGFARDASNRWRRFPQRAAVVIEDHVEIGAGACIDRGALSDTVIGRGTKIDNLAYLAHNVVVGKDCLIMAAAVVAGSCRIEDGAVLSPGAKLRNGINIGQGAHVGMGAVVVGDVAPNTVVMGVPARVVRQGTYEE